MFMYKKSYLRMSKYKRLTIAFAIAASGFSAANVASAAGESSYDDEIFPPEYLDLDQFVITADRTPVNKWTTPAKVITITDKDIEANHYQTLAEALNHVNGVIVPSRTNIPIINGFEKVLVLIDGHQLYNDGVGYRDTVELSAIPSMKNIKRIEIVKGGGSALYGSDAVTGIINIITKKGERNETTFDFNAGSWHQNNYELTNQGVAGNFGWVVTGGFHRSHPYNYPGNTTFTQNLHARTSDHKDNAFTLRFDYKFDDRNSLTLSGGYISQKNNRFYKYTSGNPYRINTIKHNDILLVYNFKENTQAPGWLRYFNNSKTRDRSDKGRISKFRVQGVDYQNSWILGQNKIVTGVEWHQTRLGHSSWDFEKREVSNRAFYLQDTISMGKKWKLIPGFRYDHNSEFGHQWSPKIATNYRADDQTKIYASWGRVYKAANPYQLYVNQSNIKGNENLRPERGNTAILGIEHDFGDKASVDFNVFYANLKNAIDAQDNKFINVANEKSRGVEVTFRQKMDEYWSYGISYNYTKVDINGMDTSSSFTQPRNNYRLALNYKRGIWNANLLGIMGHGGLDINSFDATRFAILDLNVNCKVHDNATIYLKFNNLTNQNYAYYANTYDDNGKLDDTYVSAGRSFIAGVDFKF